MEYQHTNTHKGNLKQYLVHSQVLTNKQPEVLKECLSVLQSEAMFLILSQLTGLSLHKLAPPDSDPDSDEEDEKKGWCVFYMALGCYCWCYVVVFLLLSCPFFYFILFFT